MDQMGQGLLLTVIGMGTVFISLFALAVLMRLLDWLATLREESGSDRAQASERGRGTSGAPSENSGEEDLIPVALTEVGDGEHDRRPFTATRSAKKRDRAP